MTQKSMTRTESTTDTPTPSDWQEAYMSTAAALGASWCDFMGERFHAYAHVIDDVSHCHGLDEAFKAQASFGQQTVQAYSDQAARISGLMMQAAKPGAGNGKH
jgi:hypothetical protein